MHYRSHKRPPISRRERQKASYRRSPSRQPENCSEEQLSEFLREAQSFFPSIPIYKRGTFDEVLEFLNSINVHKEMRLLPNNLAKTYHYSSKSIDKIFDSFGSYRFYGWQTRVSYNHYLNEEALDLLNAVAANLKPDIKPVLGFVTFNWVKINHLWKIQDQGKEIRMADILKPAGILPHTGCPVLHIIFERSFSANSSSSISTANIAKRSKIENCESSEDQDEKADVEMMSTYGAKDNSPAMPEFLGPSVSPPPARQKQWEPKSYKEPEPFLSQLKYIELDSIEKATDFSTYVHLLGYICDVPTESFSLQKFVLYSFNAKAVKVKDSLTTIMSLLKQRGEATIIETSWSKREDVTYRANIQFSIRPDGLFICFQPIKPKEEIRKEFRNLLAQNERAEAEETRILKRLCANPKGFFSFLKNAHLEIRDLTVSDKGVQASKKVEASTQVAFEHNEPCCLPWHHAAKNLEDKTKVVVYHSDILPGMM